MDEMNTQVEYVASEEPIVEDVLTEESRVEDNFDYNPIQANGFEEVENEETEVEVDENEFSPEDLFGEEDINTNSYQFGKYNFEKYKDVLDFSDEELNKEFNEKVGAYEKLGFTQEQIDFLLDERISDVQSREEIKAKKPTQAEIREKLQSRLSNEEIRNYKPTVNFVKDILSGTEFEVKANEILQNPILVKIFHQAYKKSLGKTTNINSVSRRQETAIKTMSFEQAERALQKAFTTKEDVNAVAKNLLSSLSGTERAKFIELTKAVGIK